MKNNRLYLYAPISHNPYTQKAIESMRCTSFVRAEEIAKKRNVSMAIWVDKCGGKYNIGINE